MNNIYHWMVSILLGFFVVFVQAAYYGFFVLEPLLKPIYGEAIYTYGYGSFFSLVMTSFAIAGFLVVLAIRLLLSLSQSFTITLIAGFCLLLCAGVYSALIMLRPNYIADFGTSWTRQEVLMELVLGQAYVLPLFFIVSLSGGLLLGFSRKRLS